MPINYRARRSAASIVSYVNGSKYNDRPEYRIIPCCRAVATFWGLNYETGSGRDVTISNKLCFEIIEIVPVNAQN
jgi:hypothetical protein